MSEQSEPVGTVPAEDMQHFTDLQRTEHELLVSIGRYIVDAMGMASQATQIRLQQQRLGEKIREDLGIPRESSIRLAVSGEVFVDAPSE